MMYHYPVDLSWNADRKGTLSSEDLKSTIEVVTPPEFPKGIAHIWSPEHLFVAAVESCLMTTFLAVAESFKLSFVSFQCKAVGKLDKVENKFQITEISLHPVVVVNDETQKELALKVLEKSEKACLISNSIKSTILFHPTVAILT